ncbi:decorin isoform X2 [Nilaparvata lugens]|uniref:decorin isoform X2 n=1 Tax=Nilaparvata lugens TaxID=108931 RepID=UPI00193E5960|nr:decorin isoform X2 [Nilaparvata lugens]XP_039286582.1 decorin isoform X2 [Nilaparvata lugens]
MELYKLDPVVVSVVWCLMVRSAGSLHQSCRMGYQFKRMTADCKDLKLNQIPMNLNHGIEILMASENRIRELKNETLEAYPNLELLYLSNNFINYVEPAAFRAVPKLEVLDLGLNGIRTLPLELPLPLRKLYLNGNRDLEKITLTSAYNLQYLSLAECHLSQMPDIGELPHLTELNLTDNPLTKITARQIAPLCRLNKLHTPDILYTQHKDSCECHEFQHWVKKFKIATTAPIECSNFSEVKLELCLSANRTELYEIRNTCLDRKPPLNLTSPEILSTAGCALLVVILVILCCLWRRSRRKQNTVRDNQKKQKVTTVV